MMCKTYWWLLMNYALRQTLRGQGKQMTHILCSLWKENLYIFNQYRKVTYGLWWLIEFDRIIRHHWAKVGLSIPCQLDLIMMLWLIRLHSISSNELSLTLQSLVVFDRKEDRVIFEEIEDYWGDFVVHRRLAALLPAQSRWPLSLKMLI